MHPFVYLAHRMSYNGKPFYARVTVEETENGNRTYTVEFSDANKMIGGGTNTQGEEHSSTPQPPMLRSILQNVMRNQAVSVESDNQDTRYSFVDDSSVLT